MFGSNKRQHTRYSTEIEVILEHDTWLRPVKVRSKDISIGGIFVYTPYTDDIHKDMELLVTLPYDDERYISLKGRVVHSIDRLGVGIKFTTPGHHIKRVLERIKRGSPEMIMGS